MSVELQDKKSDKVEIDEDALDSLHTLPLSIIPLQTPGLKKAFMIKNARLESAIELFRDGGSGSGQVEPKELHGYFQDVGGALSHDLIILDRLSSLESFDVYSLRLELRNLDIGFEDFSALQLSEAKRAELTEYMRAFTRPLIQRVYGGDQSDEINDVGQIIKMMASPNRNEAMAKLKLLADELNTELTEVPKFLERYGDIFLSLSYFRNCLDKIMQQLPPFISWMEELHTNYQIQNDRNQLKILKDIESDLNEISTSLVGRFEYFNHRSHDFWDNISADSFQSFQELVTAHHVSIGAVLCGLAVKMDLYETRFPNHGGGPVKRLEFINSEIRPGLKRIKDIEQRVGAVK